VNTITQITKKIKWSVPSSIDKDELLSACRVALKKEAVQRITLLIIGISGIAIYAIIGGKNNFDSAAKLVVFLPIFIFYSYRARLAFLKMLKAKYPAVFEELQPIPTDSHDDSKGWIGSVQPVEGAGLLFPSARAQREPRGRWVFLFIIAFLGAGFAAWEIKIYLAEQADIAAMTREFDAGCSDEAKHDIQKAFTHFARVSDLSTPYLKYLQRPRNRDQPIVTIFSELMLHYGRSELAKGEFKMAAGTFDTCLSLRPYTIEALVDRAMAFVRDGQSDRAVADATHALAMSPQNAMAYHRVHFRRAARWEIASQRSHCK
jgi:hypothetical protein